jgi:hypothetical protein
MICLPLKWWGETVEIAGRIPIQIEGSGEKGTGEEADRLGRDHVAKDPG